MTEVILNDKCAHCNDKECHDGEHFCNQAMKENSFYKNAKLYKGLEVIHRPTYAELEKENAELKEKVNILDNCDRLGDVITEAYKDQLTKAKELLKKLLSAYISYADSFDDRDNEIVEEAEQFISEVEK